MTSLEDSQGMLAVEALLMWDKWAARHDHLKALHSVDMIDWTDEKGDLTADAAQLKHDLHKAKGNERWAMCKVLAKKFNTEIEKKQRGLF